MSIQTNIAEIRSRIAAACAESGREAGEITLVGASKRCVQETEHDVFEAVFHTVMDALDARGGAVSPVKPANQPVQNPRQDFFQSMDAKSYREQGAKMCIRDRSGDRQPGVLCFRQRHAHRLSGSAVFQHAL